MARTVNLHVVTCEIKLFQNYFGLCRRPSQIILFQHVKTRLKSFQNYFRSLSYALWRQRKHNGYLTKAAYWKMKVAEQHIAMLYSPLAPTRHKSVTHTQLFPTTIFYFNPYY